MLQFQCMSASISFDDLNECHSILLASGTLSPLETFEAELGVTFKHKVEANHVIRPEQVFCRYLNSGPDNKKIRAVYSNRDNEQSFNHLVTKSEHLTGIVTINHNSLKQTLYSNREN